MKRGGLSFSSVTIRLTIAVEANLSSDPPSAVKKQTNKPKMKHNVADLFHLGICLGGR